MSHRTPTKTSFADDWRHDATCRAAVVDDPALATAWDNVDHGTFEKDDYRPDPQANVAKQLCFSCPVRLECLTDALADNEATGIRGGFRFEDGYVDRDDARKMYGEFKLRAKVKKRAPKINAAIEAMSKVQSND